MSSMTDRAAARFDAGDSCARAVLHAACERLATDPEEVLKLANGFGGGRSHVCGAVAGGIVALGIKYGRDTNDGPAGAAVAYTKIRELIGRFQRRHGGVACKDLLGGCDLQTAGGKQAFNDRGLRKTTCACCVASAAGLVEELMS